MKIVICGLVASENLGELFIARSLAYLLKNNFVGNENLEVEFLDLNARIHPIEELNKWTRKKYYIGYRDTRWDVWVADQYYIRLARWGRSTQSRVAGRCIQTLRHWLWECGGNLAKRYREHYEARFADADAVVVDGAGLLEYSFNEYQEMLWLVVRCAEKRRIPVIYNAIGRAGEYNPLDYRCGILKKALRADCVKYISARDSLETVQDCAGERHRVKLLADAAFWANEAYGIEARPSKEIGIGLIRGTALLSYGSAFGEADWVRLFSEIGCELARREYHFRFFTNGLPSDYHLGEKVLATMGLGAEYLIKRPLDDRVLMSTIAGFRGLVTCRMHSSIAAFTMGIPSVILSWNDKVDKYMEAIGYPERAVKRGDFDAATIVDRLEVALAEGINPKTQQKMRMLSEKSVRDYAGKLTTWRAELQAKDVGKLKDGIAGSSRGVS